MIRKTQPPKKITFIDFLYVCIETEYYIVRRNQYRGSTDRFSVCPIPNRLIQENKMNNTRTNDAKKIHQKKKTDNTNGVKKKTFYVFFVENGKKISILTHVQLPHALWKKGENEKAIEMYLCCSIFLSAQCTVETGSGKTLHYKVRLRVLTSFTGNCRFSMYFQ